MNSRERVLRAFGKIEGKPDRVPVQFEMCRQLNGHFAKQLGIPAFYTENLYEDVTYRISANELRLEVVNMWVNRLIGDGKLPKDQRITKTNIIKFNAPDAEKYLRVSGLMGPVKISVISTHNLR
jgi:hypothetical protein